MIPSKSAIIAPFLTMGAISLIVWRAPDLPRGEGFSESRSARNFLPAAPASPRQLSGEMALPVFDEADSAPAADIGQHGGESQAPHQIVDLRYVRLAGGEITGKLDFAQDDPEQGRGFREGTRGILSTALPPAPGPSALTGPAIKPAAPIDPGPLNQGRNPTGPVAGKASDPATAALLKAIAAPDPAPSAPPALMPSTSAAPSPSPSVADNGDKKKDSPSAIPIPLPLPLGGGGGNDGGGGSGGCCGGKCCGATCCLMVLNAPRDQAAQNASDLANQGAQNSLDQAMKLAKKAKEEKESDPEQAKKDAVKASQSLATAIGMGTAGGLNVISALSSK